MQKVMIVGCSGAGKSTLANRLGEITGIPVIHLDALFWKPGWVATPRDEWSQVVKNLVKADKWILDGNYGRTLDIRISEADTIIFLDVARSAALFRVMKRRFQYRHRTRPDMADGCQEKIDLQFIKWIWNYRRRKRPAIIAKLDNVRSTKRVITLRTRQDIEEFVGKVAR